MANLTPYWYLPNDTFLSQDQKIIYKNARLFDPESGLDQMGSLLTIGDKIADFGAGLFNDTLPEGAEIIDCQGHLLCPGLIDLQVHLREPGQSHKETLATGSKSAAAGGITTVVCQPNTKPAIDEVPVIEFIKAKAKEEAYIGILAYGAISKGLEGQQLTDMGKLVEAGIVGFTDSALPIMNAQLMRQAFSYARMLGVPIAQHAEDLNLSQGGCMNEGPVSFDLGVTGIPNISESVMVERDIEILKFTGGHYHILHVSTKEALQAIRRGKEKGLHITCEATPHHFTLTEDAVRGYKTFAKVNPPLRSESDRQAIIEGLRDGTIDAITTDHAPHDEDSKRLPLASAAFGIVGLETLLPLSLELYHQGIISLRDLLAKMTSQPANIIKQPLGRLKKGYRADLTLIDLNLSWVIQPELFASKSKNSPFSDRNAKGKAVRTIFSGKKVYELR